MTKVPNRLIHEISPYLLQHAYNPVDWFPWSESFQKPEKRTNPSFYRLDTQPAIGAMLWKRNLLNEEAARLSIRILFRLK